MRSAPSSPSRTCRSLRIAPDPGLRRPDRDTSDRRSPACCCSRLVVATDWVDGYVARRTGPGLRAREDPRPGRRPARDRRRPDRAHDPRRVPAVGGPADPRARRRRPGGRARRAPTGAAPGIDVRFIGKVATFSLMVAIPAIAWGNLGTCRRRRARRRVDAATPAGIVEYYLAAALYVGRHATARRDTRRVKGSIVTRRRRADDRPDEREDARGVP